MNIFKWLFGRVNKSLMTPERLRDLYLMKVKANQDSINTLGLLAIWVTDNWGFITLPKTSFWQLTNQEANIGMYMNEHLPCKAIVHRTDVKAITFSMIPKMFGTEDYACLICKKLQEGKTTVADVLCGF